ncbi:MAG: DUF1236 domain-containing protein [Pseudomonadota bacterium]
MQKPKKSSKAWIALAVLAGAFSAPLAAQAQTTIIEDRGGTVGMAPSADLIISETERPAFREYVVRERVPSYAVSVPIARGSVLPEAGVTYYEVPQQYGATTYRYTVVNDRTVLVDPRSRRIMQVID